MTVTIKKSGSITVANHSGWNFKEKTITFSKGEEIKVFGTYSEFEKFYLITRKDGVPILLDSLLKEGLLKTDRKGKLTFENKLILPSYLKRNESVIDAQTTTKEIVLKICYSEEAISFSAKPCGNKSLFNRPARFARNIMKKFDNIELSLPCYEGTLPVFVSLSQKVFYY